MKNIIVRVTFVTLFLFACAVKQPPRMNDPLWRIDNDPSVIGFIISDTLSTDLQKEYYYLLNNFDFNIEMTGENYIYGYRYMKGTIPLSVYNAVGIRTEFIQVDDDVVVLVGFDMLAVKKSNNEIRKLKMIENVKSKFKKYQKHMEELVKYLQEKIDKDK